MAVALKVYETERRQDKGESNLVIFLPYAWGGDYHNNWRLQEDLAMRTGALIIGAQTPGTGKLHVNRGMRRRLRPGQLQDLANDYAEEVNMYLNALGRPRRLLVGQSGRVALAAHMQLSPSRPFTRVLLRDGVNLNAPQGILEGYRHLRSQPSKGEHSSDSPAPEHKTRAHKALDKLAFLHGLVEVATQGPLLCSEEPTNAVTRLAKDKTTPVYHVTFENGITGAPELQQEFNASLMSVRDLAGGRDHVGQPFVAEMVAGNHADLLNVGLLHRHIQKTLTLAA